MTIKKFKEVIEINGDNLNVHYEFNNEKTLAYTITGIYLDNGRQIMYNYIGSSYHTLQAMIFNVPNGY